MSPISTTRVGKTQSPSGVRFLLRCESKPHSTLPERWWRLRSSAFAFLPISTPMRAEASLDSTRDSTRAVALEVLEALLAHRHGEDEAERPHLSEGEEGSGHHHHHHHHQPRVVSSSGTKIASSRRHHRNCRNCAEWMAEWGPTVEYACSGEYLCVATASRRPRRGTKPMRRREGRATATARRPTLRFGWFPPPRETQGAAPDEEANDPIRTHDARPPRRTTARERHAAQSSDGTKHSGRRRATLRRRITRDDREGRAHDACNACTHHRLTPRRQRPDEDRGRAHHSCRRGAARRRARER